MDPNLAVHSGIQGLPLAWFGISTKPRTTAPISRPGQGGYRAGPWYTEWSSKRHRRAVLAVRERIAAGDCYQVNLTTRMTAPVCGELGNFYADLASAQKGSYNAYLDCGRFAIVGASPELFFEMRDGRLLTRPMKGTAPRGQTPAEDRALASALGNSAKDRAENVMIVDLMRNDLAPIATTGSVRVSTICRLETYGTVHQLVSEIGAQLRREVGLTEVFRALFPAGSVTGAPKIETMRIIRALEPKPRGVYCGAVGVVGPGYARFNVAIRTVLVDRSTNTATYGAGGAITWASNPASEYAELLTKAEVLLAAGAVS
ncbi:aminodeoxychorismate synthase component I [Mycobacterium paraense]|uniref:aminodeoxychorismate synthase component I n=1 Tax=Mycobacterium paraense TaxID=767916 RepID=UPI001F4D5F11|nr:aminodeoxychorismate synthase component I [Mycobacterium paraense]